MKSIKYILLVIPFISFAQNKSVGIRTTTPTETLQVNGTTRVAELPLNGTTNAINTNANGNLANSKQPFNATKTVVVDKNGVLGTVNHLPFTTLPEVSTIKYVTKTTPINSNTQANSVVSLGNLSVRLDVTSDNPSGEQSISFKLLNGVVDNVVIGEMKIGSGGVFSNHDTKFSTPTNPSSWVVIDNNQPNINNKDFIQYNIALLNTKEMYRLTAVVNGNISGNSNQVASSAKVTLFLEQLTGQ